MVSGRQDDRLGQQGQDGAAVGRRERGGEGHPDGACNQGTGSKALESNFQTVGYQRSITIPFEILNHPQEVVLDVDDAARPSQAKISNGLESREAVVLYQVAADESAGAPEPSEAVDGNAALCLVGQVSHEAKGWSEPAVALMVVY